MAVCEPRRVAAISLANRVADETGTLVQGGAVGYAVRFDACTNKPKIKVCTHTTLCITTIGVRFISFIASTK